MGRTADYSRQSCSIAATLEVIGDPWTLLVIRDAFNGVSRFEQWQDRLGVARNVLAARLKSLVQHGVLEPRLYSERPSTCMATPTPVSPCCTRAAAMS